MYCNPIAAGLHDLDTMHMVFAHNSVVPRAVTPCIVLTRPCRLARQVVPGGKASLVVVGALAAAVITNQLLSTLAGSLT